MKDQEKLPVSLNQVEDLRRQFEQIERDIDRVDVHGPLDTVRETVGRDTVGDWSKVTEQALEATGVVVLAIDARGRIVHFSRGAEYLTGYSVSEVLGRSIWGFLVPEEEAGRVELTFAELHAGQLRNRHDSVILDRAGKRYMLTWSNAAITASNGVVRYIVSSGLDITTRTKREKSIRSAGERYKRLIENALDVIWEYDLVGLDAAVARIRRGETTLERVCDPHDPEIEFQASFISPAVTRLLGFTPDEMLKRSLKQHFTPRCFALCYQLLAGQMEQEIVGVQTGPIVTELEEYHKDGSVVLTRVKVQFTRDATGFPTGIAGISTDITREKKAEQALQENLQQYRMLVESSPSAIVLQRRGVTVYANPVTAELLRANSLDQIVGRPLTDFVHADCQHGFQQRLSEVLQNQVVVRGEATLLRFDGSAFVAEVVGIPIHHDGEPSIQVVAADISRRKQLEQETRQIAEIRARLDLLSPREGEVLRLVVAGSSNKAVANELGISIKTVEHHRSNLMKKTRASGVADLVRMTITAGW